MKTSTASGSIKAHASEGKVYYHVECPTPPLPKGAVVTVSLAEHNGKAIPFIGCPTCNTYEVDALHEETKLVSNYPDLPIYEVYGMFSKGATYKCEFKGTSGTVVRTVKAESNKKIVCGTGPTSK